MIKKWLERKELKKTKEKEKPLPLSVLARQAQPLSLPACSLTLRASPTADQPTRHPLSLCTLAAQRQQPAQRIFPLLLLCAAARPSWSLGPARSLSLPFCLAASLVPRVSGTPFLLPRAGSKQDSIPPSKSQSSRDLLALEPNRAPYKNRDLSSMSLFPSRSAWEALVAIEAEDWILPSQIRLPP